MLNIFYVQLSPPQSTPPSPSCVSWPFSSDLHRSESSSQGTSACVSNHDSYLQRSASRLSPPHHLHCCCLPSLCTRKGLSVYHPIPKEALESRQQFSSVAAISGCGSSTGEPVQLPFEHLGSNTDRRGWCPLCGSASRCSSGKVLPTARGFALCLSESCLRISDQSVALAELLRS